MIEEDLFKIVVPGKTRSYSPISHRDIIETTENYLNTKGFGVHNKSYQTAKGGLQMIGKWRLNGGNTEMAPMIVFRNSYDKSMSLGYAIGTQIFICSNGCIAGDIGSIKRKHTGSIRMEIEDKIQESIDLMSDQFKYIETMSNELKTYNITTRLAAELLGRMYIEDKILNTTELNIVKRELENPTYPAFSNTRAWDLYNHCTHALKEEHVTTSIKKHVELTKFFEEEFC